MPKKTLIVEGTVKQYEMEGRKGDYVELITTVNGVPIKLYAKNGDVTGKLLLMQYFKTE